MNEYYECCICGKLIKKDNIYGNYENYVCDKCWDKETYRRKYGKQSNS